MNYILADLLKGKKVSKLTTNEINQLAVIAKSEIERLRREGKQIIEENFTLPLWCIGEVFREEIAKLHDQHALKFNRTKDIDGETAYERRLKKKLFEAVEHFSPQKGDFPNLVHVAFKRATGEFYRRRVGVNKVVSYDYITEESDCKTDKKRISYLSDRKRSVESEVVLTEIIESLYKEFGYCKKRKFILDRFLEGNRSCVEIAKMMSGKFCGTVQGNGKFLYRFKKELQRFILNEFGLVVLMYLFM
jgi:hypothetical protein